MNDPQDWGDPLALRQVRDGNFVLEQAFVFGQSRVSHQCQHQSHCEDKPVPHDEPHLEKVNNL